MRYGDLITPLLSVLLRNVIRTAVFLLAASWAAGCATTAPVKLELNEVITNPQAHKNERVEVTGDVIDYEPARGDAYRTLQFTLGLGPDEKILVFSAGYTADAIAKASKLVEEAFRAREPITVAGKLRVGPEAETVGGVELRLERVEYRGRKIDVTRGRRTRPGFEVGAWHVTPSIGIGATFTP
ncbi:MAG: hypothetical protein JSV16_04470 [Candidatus Hydrogenedentota bacterium]|nr:MAG: hypothetical protein JSV16_04470 [Candidatus Hydrogenedentota bacterium]